MVRTVRRAVWWLEAETAVFEIEARAFCHQMVRSLVALLVSVGLGRHKPSDVGAVIAARDRSALTGASARLGAVGRPLGPLRGVSRV